MRLRTILLAALLSGCAMAQDAVPLLDWVINGAPSDVTAGLIYRWTMDSTNGGYFADSVSGTNLTTIGSPIIVAGKVGAGAASFNEDSASGQAATNGTLSITGLVCTLTFWMWWGTNTSTVAMEYSQNYNNASGFEFEADTITFGAFLHQGVGGNSYSGGGPTVLPTHNAWHHYIIEMNYAATTGALNGVSWWIDGAPVATTQTQAHDISTGMFSPNSGLYVAARGGALYPFIGRFDDIRIYNRILSSAEKTIIYGQK